MEKDIEFYEKEVDLMNSLIGADKQDIEEREKYRLICQQKIVKLKEKENPLVLNLRKRPDLEVITIFVIRIQKAIEKLEKYQNKIFFYPSDKDLQEILKILKGEE